MFAHVLLINGCPEPFWYHIPDQLHAVVGVGSLVHVPLKTVVKVGMVMVVTPVLDPKITYTLRDVEKLAAFPGDPHYRKFIERVAHFYCLSPLYFYQRLQGFMREKNLRKELAQLVPAGIPVVELTDEQEQAVQAIVPLIDNPKFAPFVLHGVTGSGKTEVYKKIIMRALEQNKTVVLLLPEVSLALRFQHILTQGLPGMPIFGFHSGTSPRERGLLWKKLMLGRPMLLIGVHLPMLLPLPNLGLIIIDEEHEQGFAEQSHPKINARELALWRASQYQIPIVLGSATPSLSSLYNVQQHGWKLLKIMRRFAGAFPTITRVLLTDKSLQRGTNFWVSRELERSVRERLDRKEQVIIFINRRGHSFFVQCKTCGDVPMCGACSVSLTYHESDDLRCHYCAYTRPLPATCTACKPPGGVWVKKGLGTQQAVQIFKELFPQAVIERVDLDSNKQQQEIIKRMHDGAIDILIGTQSITKGYHFPKVTLVGVLWADVNANFPLYNAAETTLQQLIQVAGRAGRQCAGGEVIVQMMRDNPLFQHVNEEYYLEFAQQELEVRQLAGYPPCMRLACIELRHEDPVQINRDAKELVAQLQELATANGLAVRILGPAMPVISRIQNCEVRHIMLKGQVFKDVHQLLLVATQARLASDVFVAASQ